MADFRPRAAFCRSHALHAPVEIVTGNGRHKGHLRRRRVLRIDEVFEGVIACHLNIVSGRVLDRRPHEIRRSRHVGGILRGRDQGRRRDRRRHGYERPRSGVGALADSLTPATRQKYRVSKSRPDA